ncbi:hypothetical protein O181_037640 [Austropuccinia psidii MF-1]|uniref:Secreted protein n=1 Tax=Austropuccinia psidii MF-1 TaxID=1389203 RepID=A0A9Q3D8J4_9BASI|nr:hypothetical protein [Austropuccinia psidii MF-1]
MFSLSLTLLTLLFKALVAPAEPISFSKRSGGPDIPLPIRSLQSSGKRIESHNSPTSAGNKHNPQVVPSHARLSPSDPSGRTLELFPEHPSPDSVQGK